MHIVQGIEGAAKIRISYSPATWALHLHVAPHTVRQSLQGIQGVPEIRQKYNPATWALDVTNGASERRLGLDFADAYGASALYRSALASADMHRMSLVKSHLYYRVKHWGLHGACCPPPIGAVVCHTPSTFLLAALAVCCMFGMDVRHQKSLTSCRMLGIRQARGFHMVLRSSTYRSNAGAHCFDMVLRVSKYRSGAGAQRPWCSS